MALRVPMLLLVSGTFLGGAASAYVAPTFFTSIPANEASAAILAPVPQSSAEAASSPQQVKEASAATDCKAPVWPYVTRGCAGQDDAANGRPERQVRVISTNRDAPSRVLVPALETVRAPLPEKLQVATLPDVMSPTGSAAPNSGGPIQDPVAFNDGVNDGDGTKAVFVSVLPPQKPAVLAAGYSKAEMDAAPAAGSVDTASSIRPVAQDAATRPRNPARPQVVRIERPRRDMSERIRQARRSFDEGDDSVVQTTTYQYADGRQLVFRSEPHRQDRRRWIDEEPMVAAPAVEPRPTRPGSDALAGWLGQFGR